MTDIEDIARDASAKMVRAYDDHVIEFLSRNGVKVDRRNVAATIAELEKQGLKVVVEAEQKALESITYRIYLTNIVDKTEFKMIYSLKVGDE